MSSLYKGSKDSSNRVSLLYSVLLTNLKHLIRVGCHTRPLPRFTPVITDSSSFLPSCVPFYYSTLGTPTTKTLSPQVSLKKNIPITYLLTNLQPTCLPTNQLTILPTNLPSYLPTWSIWGLGGTFLLVVSFRGNPTDKLPVSSGVPPGLKKSKLYIQKTSQNKIWKHVYGLYRQRTYTCYHRLDRWNPPRSKATTFRTERKFNLTLELGPLTMEPRTLELGPLTWKPQCLVKEGKLYIVVKRFVVQDLDLSHL